MLRRSFLQMCAAALAVPLVTKFEPVTAVLSPVPVLAVETSAPYWLLEMQAYERFFAEWGPRRGKTLYEGRIPKLPLHPEVHDPRNR